MLVKHHIVPLNPNLNHSIIAPDVLKNLYAQRKEARVVMFKRHLEATKMKHSDSMDTFLTKIKDFKKNSYKKK